MVLILLQEAGHLDETTENETTRKQISKLTFFVVGCVDGARVGRREGLVDGRFDGFGDSVVGKTL